MDAPEPAPADEAVEPASSEGDSEPTAAQDESNTSTEEPEAASTLEGADTHTIEATPDVTSEEPTAVAQDAADMAPIEVATVETEASDEEIPTADTMQDISDWEKNDDDVSDMGISDWERDDDASSQPGESETNPSEHQDFDEESIAQDPLEPAHEDEKLPDQDEPKTVEVIRPSDAATSAPVTDDVGEDVVVSIDVKEDEPIKDDTSAAVPEVVEQNEASTSETSPESSEPQDTGDSIDASAEDQTPETRIQESTEEAQLAVGDAPAPQEPAPEMSQPSVPGENAITDASTDAQDDASAHESPVDESEPAVSSEAAKDSEQVIVSATPDDVENPDSCTGTYLLCFLCFTSLCPSALLFAGSITHVWTIARHASGESG